jgi:biotin carboxyl carrier protein
MRYFVTLEPTKPPIEVDVRELPSGALDVSAAGSQVDVDLAIVGQALSVRVDGRVVDLTTEGAPPELGVIASGHRSYIRVESDRLRAAAAASSHATTSGDDVLRSPMPGRILRVLVSPGDDVVIGQPVVVVEAMKMENELRAKRVGRVAEVLVVVGATVESNAKLVRFAQ